VHSPDVLPATNRWLFDGVDFAVDTALGMTIRGHFDRFAGSYEAGPYGTRIELAVDVASVDTENRIWNGLVRSVDSRALVEHPHLSFTSTHVREAHDGTLRVEGRLEAAGKIEPLAFDAAVKEDGHGFRLETFATIDRQRLGRPADGLGVFLPATVHVTMHFGMNDARSASAPDRPRAA
jgi:polyisoprenoid-binding protein YceI